MFRRVFDALAFVALMLLAPLAVTTLKFFLSVGFPYDMVTGVGTSVSVMLYFAMKAEDGHWQTLYLCGALAALMTAFGLMFASAGAGFSFLMSGEMWVLGAFVWVLLSVWVSLGTLLGKNNLNPVTP